MHGLPVGPRRTGVPAVPASILPELPEWDHREEQPELSVLSEAVRDVVSERFPGE